MPDATCSINGCTLPVARPTRGWCEAHYTRWRRHGDPLGGGAPRIMGDDESRFLSYLVDHGECWIYTGANAGGYGRFYFGDRVVPAHRYAYELLVGPIPEGLQLDHLCRDRACCNPDHLEPVTQRENLRRGIGPAGLNARKTKCPKGHPYDEANTYTHSAGWRQCRACRREMSRRRRT